MPYGKKTAFCVTVVGLLMTWFLLAVEVLLDFVALVLAIMLIAGAAGNRLRLWWGAMVLMASGMLLHNNLMWLLGYYEPSAPTLGYGLLVARRMVEWFVVVTPAFLYPLATLRPAYLTPLRFVSLLIPVGVITLVTICYYWFDGYTTELNSLADVLGNLQQFNVQLRLVLFVASLVIPIVYLLIPVLGHFSSVRRRATLKMSVFVALQLFILVYYAAFTLFPTRFLFDTYGMVIVVFAIYGSALHLMYENPLSHRMEKGEEAKSAPENKKALTGAEALFGKMSVYFENNASYTNPAYTLRDMAGDLGAKQLHVVEAIKNSGFAGFKDYLSYLRVEHFKRLAGKDKGLSVKELMNISGFTSRSSFYRIFTEFEGTTPSGFMSALGGKSLPE